LRVANPCSTAGKRIAAYQFSMPEEVELRLPSDFEFLPKIYDDAVLRSLTSLGDDALLGPPACLCQAVAGIPGQSPHPHAADEEHRADAGTGAQGTRDRIGADRNWMRCGKRGSRTAGCCDNHR
jgi:hypothetical protein